MNFIIPIPYALVYLKPYLQQVSHISNYTLKTQWKFQLSFEADLRQIRDNSILGRHYALSVSSLPHIITALERNLGVGITDRTPIHLVVYVTPCEIAPVYIYQASGERLNETSNGGAFISAKWGGIIIVNPPADVCHLYNEKFLIKRFHLRTNDVMPVMLYQLQRLLDINVEVKMSVID